jgi:hypothetical protein
MGNLEKKKGERVHTRSIRIDTFAVDEGHVIVEGVLEDTRHLSYYSISNQLRQPCQLHGMVVRLLIGGMPVRILDAEGEMPEVPMEECGLAADSVKKLVDLPIVYGFSKEVKERLDGVEGCNHLTSLILTMGSAAVQGMAAHRAQKPADPDSGAFMLDYLKNTCCSWREDGASYRRVREDIRAAREKNGPGTGSG